MTDVGRLWAVENTFDLALRSLKTWTPDQCVRMIDALRRRISEAEDAMACDPLFQPIDAQQFQRELLEAQADYRRGDYMDALEFCDEMERRRL